MEDYYSSPEERTKRQRQKALFQLGHVKKR